MKTQTLMAVILTALAASAPPRAWAAPRPPASPERIAAAKAQADALIASTGAPALFINTTDSESPRVRHAPSNLTCVFNVDSADNRLEISADAVLCGSASAAMTTRLSAKRIDAALPEAEVSAEAARALAAALTSPSPIKAEGPAFTLGSKTFGQASTVNGEREGRKAAAWIGVLDAGQWRVTQQVEAANPMIAQMSGALLLKTALLRLSGVIPN